MNSPLKFVGFCIGMLLASIALSAVLVFYNVDVRLLRGGNTVLQQTTSALDTKGYVMYEGSSVTGQTVRYVVDTYNETDFIRVVTNRKRTGVVEFTDMKNSDSEDYIDPSKMYTAQVYYDTNNSPVGVLFREYGSTVTNFAEAADGDALRAEFAAETSSANLFGRDPDAYLESLNTQVNYLKSQLALKMGEYNYVQGMAEIRQGVISERLNEFVDLNTIQRQKIKTLSEQLETMAEIESAMYHEMERQVEEYYYDW